LSDRRRRRSAARGRGAAFFSYIPNMKGWPRRCRLSAAPAPSSNRRRSSSLYDAPARAAGHDQDPPSHEGNNPLKEKIGGDFVIQQQRRGAFRGNPRAMTGPSKTRFKHEDAALQRVDFVARGLHDTLLRRRSTATGPIPIAGNANSHKSRSRNCRPARDSLTQPGRVAACWCHGSAIILRWRTGA